MIPVALEMHHAVANTGLAVMTEGEYGSEMFLIADGEVEIYRNLDPHSATARLAAGEVPEDGQGSPRNGGNGVQRVRLGRLGTRGFFGERAVMRVSKRDGDTNGAHLTAV